MNFNIFVFIIFFALGFIVRPNKEVERLRELREDMIVKWLNEYSVKLDKKIIQMYNFFIKNGVRVKTFKLENGTLSVTKNGIVLKTKDNTFYIYKEGQYWNFICSDYIGNYQPLSNALATASVVFASAYQEYLEENGLA